MLSDHQRFASDFQWLAFCPNLLQSALSLTLDSLTANQSTIDFAAVDRFRERRGGHRVGAYVESLVLAALESNDAISEIQHGIQIQKGNETRGELDFLYRQDGLLYHLEVAIKLFLYSPSHTVRGSLYIGPNTSDTFERKRDKLLQKQVPLGKVCYPEIDESRVLVKGLIFYHPNDESEPNELPEGLNPEHQRGTWIHEDEMEIFFRRHASLTPVIMDKPFWLACPPITGEHPDTEALVDAIRTRVRDRGLATLVSLVEKTGDGFRERERVFIVPQSWPL